MDLPLVWFALVVLCWVLFVVLEGFDFGVGMLAPLLGRDPAQRGAALRTIAPVWDGNEVWLVAAIGVTFAAFPDWYAAMLAGLYLPLVLLLLMLAVRGVALEFRGKKDSAGWRRRCDVALALSSAATAAAVGGLLGALTGGLALDRNGDVTGGALGRSLAVLVEPHTVVGALAGLLAAVALGATYLGLRTTGPVRERARSWALPAALVLAVGAVLLVMSGELPWVWGLAVAVSAAVSAAAVRAGREAWAFGVMVVAVGLGAVVGFLGRYPVVLPSTLDPAWSLTVDGAAASQTALQTVSVAALVILPGVLAYQALAYWVFRKRVTSEPVPT
ncbi:cytochrome d ubiquinol oxidase subunit II [Georgenia halophila]|uniref:Cytochrome d ubiquinol oxidase subunit II n=1 Tax=Georgenia halophila TaxID=620889 RepID=A0ABP8LBT5_9MICO